MAIVPKNVVDAVEKVTEVLDGEPCIRVIMKRRLINVRALARWIIKEKKIDATLDSAISIIRRYRLEDSQEIFEKARKNLIGAAISTKSDLGAIRLSKSIRVQRLLPKLFLIINYEQADVLRIIQAEASIKILLDRKNLDEAKSLFPEEDVLGMDTSLGEINIHLDSSTRYIPGICAVVSNEFAINSINILESMSCYPESLWFVEEKDLSKAYDVIYKVCKHTPLAIG